MNLQNKNHGRFCRTDRRTDGRTDGHFLDIAQLKLRTTEVEKWCLDLQYLLMGVLDILFGEISMFRSGGAYFWVFSVVLVS